MTERPLDQDQLRELSARVARLPREIDPPDDAWAGIDAAIRIPPKPVAVAFWQRPMFLAAAALLLAAGSSAITAIALDRNAEGSEKRVAVAVSPPAGSMGSGEQTSAALAEFTKHENDYISMASRLLAIIESDQVTLAPQTIAKLKESVRVIDAAILEARRALAEDPANTQLIEILTNSWNQKLDLLKRTSDMGRS